jgi:hypothetical protein
MKLQKRFAFGLPVLLALAGAVAGCDGQADPDYKGEPLATVQGHIVDDADDPSPAGDVILLWSTIEDSIYVGSSAPVSGSFPADFTMPVYAPPPDGALVTSPEDGIDHVGFAYIIVVKKGAVTDGDTHVVAQSIENATLGVASNNIVVYVGGEIDPDSWVAKKVGSSLSPGYHLLNSRPPTAAEVHDAEQCQDQAGAAYDHCVAACNGNACENRCGDAEAAATDQCGDFQDRLSVAPGGFDTAITIHLGDANLRFPNWM